MANEKYTDTELFNFDPRSINWEGYFMCTRSHSRPLETCDEQAEPQPSLSRDISFLYEMIIVSLRHIVTIRSKQLTRT